MSGVEGGLTEGSSTMEDNGRKTSKARPPVTVSPVHMSSDYVDFLDDRRNHNPEFSEMDWKLTEILAMQMLEGRIGPGGKVRIPNRLRAEASNIVDQYIEALKYEEGKFG